MLTNRVQKEIKTEAMFMSWFTAVALGKVAPYAPHPSDTAYTGTIHTHTYEFLHET